MSGPLQPLYKRTILVTRPAERNAELKRKLERLGARVDARPTIHLDLPADLAPALAALRGLSRYDWVVFTSPSGVRFFDLVGRRATGRAPAPAGSLAAIGPGTARALVERGSAPAIVADGSRAEVLAEAVVGQIRRGQRVLVVRPEQAREVLPEALREAGARVDAVPFYRTLPARGIVEIAADIRRGAYEVVVFTSGSTALRLLEGAAAAEVQISDALRRAKVVALGEVTARALVEVGLAASAVAATPSDDGIVEAVCSLFRS